MDSGRLYYEAALLFDDMSAFERAVVCYLKSTRFCSAEDVVAAIDQQEDEAYRKKLERMSQFHLPIFYKSRDKQRQKYITAELERQRLRVRTTLNPSFSIKYILKSTVDRSGRPIPSSSAFTF